uniref:Uncharacterized protein n=1 Tax=Anguilla anguilla TaxID=7936 RepID=A0A0E9T4J6_ANGAN
MCVCTCVCVCSRRLSECDCTTPVQQ